MGSRTNRAHDARARAREARAVMLAERQAQDERIEDAVAGGAAGDRGQGGRAGGGRPAGAGAGGRAATAGSREGRPSGTS